MNPQDNINNIDQIIPIENENLKNKNFTQPLLNNNNFISPNLNSANIPQNNIENFIQDQQMNNNQEKYNLPAPYTNDANNQPMFYQNYNIIPQNQNQEINQYYNIPTQNNQYNNNLNQNHQNGMKKKTNSKKRKLIGVILLMVFYLELHLV